MPGIREKKDQNLGKSSDSNFGLVTSECQYVSMLAKSVVVWWGMGVAWNDQNCRRISETKGGIGGQVNGNIRPWWWEVMWSGVGAPEVKHQYRITDLSQIDVLMSFVCSESSATVMYEGD